jgi:putative MATE family efflux protein
MLSAERRRKILRLALPIIGGMVSQNVLNLVDTAMVGTLGAASLAAVGMASFANFMASAFITGLSAGVQAIAARRVGQGRHHESAAPLNGGLLLAMALAVPWSALLIWQTPRLFPLLVDDPAVVALGIPYFRARLVAMVALGINFAFRGYWNGVNLSRLYMRTLVLMHATNIVLSWVLIFGYLGLPALGSTGAGIGSAVATFLGAGYYMVLGLKHARPGGFLRGLPSRETLASMLRLSVPAGVQQLFFATGMTVLFWILGQVGTAELAASTVLVQLLLVVLLPSMGFGLASASLVGQALGRGDPAEARQWGWDVCKLAAVLVGLVCIPAVVVPGLLLGGFLHDPEALALATTPLRLLGLTMAADTVGMVLLNSLLGAGYNRVVMAVSTGLQWGLFLPLAYLLGPVLGLGMLAIWIAQVAYRGLQAGVLVAIWRRDAWTRVKV